MSDDVMIVVKDVWKRYGLGFNQEARRWWHSLKKEVQSIEMYGPWALQNINLELRRGETLGVIGRNGAGKSTLLKILAGVSPYNSGQIKTQGQIFPMIELNAGLNMDLTGRENVYLLGTIMGLSPAIIRSRMPQIEEFCELGNYFNQPVRKYSSGMLARLGFAVAINVDADILLVDEVLGVGDFSFQNKCQAHFKNLRGQQTLIFVTHNMAQLPYVCEKTIYLVEGRIKAFGPSQEVIAEYEQDSLAQSKVHSYLSTGVFRRDSSGHVEIKSALVQDQTGQPIDEIESNQSFILSVEGICYDQVQQPLFAFAILDAMGNICWWHFSVEDGYEFGPLKGYFRVTAQVPPLPLRGGRCTINFTMRDAEGFVNLERLWLTPINIKSVGRSHGILTARAIWTLDLSGFRQ